MFDLNKYFSECVYDIYFHFYHNVVSTNVRLLSDELIIIQIFKTLNSVNLFLWQKFNKLYRVYVINDKK